MRKLLRFKLRTLLVLVAVIAASLVLLPKLWWRYKVNSAIDTTLNEGPDFNWKFDPHASDRIEDFAYLLSDSERVLKRLLTTVQTDDNESRRVNALRSIRNLTARSGSFEVRQRLLPRLIAIVANGDVTAATEHELAATIADWIPATGLSPQERQVLLARTKAAGAKQRIAWIAVMDAIGGRDETLLMLEYGDSHDQSQLWAVYNSQFRGTTWRGMLPHLKRWLDDPIIAETALEFSTLSQTTKGRGLLVQYVTDESRPANLRQKAVDQLTQTIAGTEQLQTACENDSVAKMLTTLLASDSRAHLASVLTKLRSHNGRRIVGGTDRRHRAVVLATIASCLEAQRGCGSN